MNSLHAVFIKLTGIALLSLILGACGGGDGELTASSTDIPLPSAPATGTDPGPGTFEFSSSTYSVGENGGSVNITINRTGGSVGEVTLEWRTMGVTAAYDQDYGSFLWTPLTFADGETSKILPITITQDSVVEGDETFSILLQNPTSGATLGGRTTSVVTILDDDNGTDPVSGTDPVPVIGTGVATVNWTPPTENTDGTALVDLAGYKIHYGTSPDNLYNNILINNPGITSFVIENLANNTTYYFSVTAVNSKGMESGFSNIVSKYASG